MASSMSPLQTEYSFTLPRGFVDPQGQLCRDGTMRLATAMDEIAPLRDPRVRDNQAYLAVVILSRVITRLGEIHEITPGMIEKLFTADLAFLQDFYRRINTDGVGAQSVTCPNCNTTFPIDSSNGHNHVGES